MASQKSHVGQPVAELCQLTQGASFGTVPVGLSGFICRPTVPKIIKCVSIWFAIVAYCMMSIQVIGGTLALGEQGSFFFLISNFHALQEYYLSSLSFLVLRHIMGMGDSTAMHDAFKCWEKC